MSESCEHNCGSCGADCSERSMPQRMKEALNKDSSVKKVIGIVSGKGGVGKSLVTSLLACAYAKKGYKTAILDADITGPSIPKIFGLHNKVTAVEDTIIPAETKNGIKVISVNLLLQNETDPVIWRGPIIAGTVKEFWSDVYWGDIDYMFVDMPPGTGDVPLTVFQSLPVDGIIIVTSPQELVEMIVKKAYNMAGLLHVPVLGVVENMAYFECPDCGKKHYIYGEGKTDNMAKEHGIPKVARIPIDPLIASKCDEGLIEELDADYLDDFAD